MGVIYRIQNLENGKTYIGQTVQPLKNRILEHLLEAKKPHDIDTLYYDINLYGIDNFNVEILEKCSNDKLSDRERFWIDKYDTYNNGYNKTRGGAASPSKYYDTDKIIQMANDGKTITEIAATIGSSLSFVRSRLDMHNIKYTKRAGGGPLKVVMYSSEWEPLKLWDSISQAYIGLGGLNTSQSSFQHNVRVACGTLDELYGYHWALLNDLIYYIDGKLYICKTPFDRDNIQNGMDYSISKNVIYTKIDPSVMAEVARCRFCGSNVDSGENICKECIKKHPRCFENRYYNKNNDCISSNTDNCRLIPSKEILEHDMAELSYSRMAKKYGVSTKTLVDKLKEYGIYKEKINRLGYLEIAEVILRGLSIKEVVELTGASKWKVEEVIKYYNIPRWVYSNDTPVIAQNIVSNNVVLFFSLTEAVSYIAKDNLSASAKNSLRWRIGNAAKTNSIYQGYLWKLANKEMMLNNLRDKIVKNN